MKKLIILALLSISVQAEATISRSSYQVQLFRKATVCPSTGWKSPKCPGYIVDHIKPRCLGGPDKPSNMQYQTYQASLRKDRQEREDCRAKRLAG